MPSSRWPRGRLRERAVATRRAPFHAGYQRARSADPGTCRDALFRDNTLTTSRRPTVRTRAKLILYRHLRPDRADRRTPTQHQDSMCHTPGARGARYAGVQLFSGPADANEWRGANERNMDSDLPIVADANQSRVGARPPHSSSIWSPARPSSAPWASMRDSLRSRLTSEPKTKDRPVIEEAEMEWSTVRYPSKTGQFASNDQLLHGDHGLNAEELRLA
jgi:hypothetical protein